MSKPIVNKLNDLYHKHFSIDLKGLQPLRFIDVENTSVTVPPTNVDAYNLKPCIAGSLLKYEGKSQTKDVAVYRSMLGYALATKCAENETLFIYTVSAMINDGLRQLTREIGDLSNRDIITSGRPGVENLVFRDLDSHAGFEFRIFVGNNNNE